MNHYREKIKIFACNGNRRLAEDISTYLEMSLAKAHLGAFPDGEIQIKIEEDVRGNDVFVIQPTCPPVNHNLMELLLLIDSLKRASAARITAVIPYFGYARQDRKDEGRVPISAKLVANMLTSAGANRIVGVDLHAPQIQGFFDIPFDHLSAQNIIVDYFRKRGVADCVVTSPDVGSIKLCLPIAKALGIPLATVDKRRINATTVEAASIIGSVSGKNVILIDDMVTTGGSIVEAARAVRQFGAKEVSVAITHPVFCGNAYDRLDSFDFKEIIVTDTIPLDTFMLKTKITKLSVARLLGEAIRRVHENRSISELFKN